MTEAVNRAIGYLESARNGAGWWQDFRLAPGFSDEWVMGYTGSALAGLPVQRARELAASAWTRLQPRQRPTGGWGYNFLPPGDGDSSTWALILAQRLGDTDSEAVQRGRDFLSQHVLSVGGVTTYAHEAPIRRFISAPPERSFAGWCGPHTCVTGATAHLETFAGTLAPYLIDMQRDDGSWHAYWWCDHEYATAQAVTSLAVLPDIDPSILQRAATWAAGRLTSQGYIPTSDHPTGSPFATAGALTALKTSGGPPDAIATVTRWLLSNQAPDGSWESSARLRLPLPEDIDPDSYTAWIYGGPIEGSIVFDQRRIFTTSTVLSALASP